MAPGMRFLLAGVTFLVVALFALLALVTSYWPFQSVVQVIAPFLVLSVLTSIGTTLILAAFLFPRAPPGSSGPVEQTSAIDWLLSEMKPRP
jgi:hypothetical protein